MAPGPASNAVFTVMANGMLKVAVAGVKKHPVNWLWSRLVDGNE